MPTTEADLLVTELVLMERGYDDVPKRVDQAMRRVDEANARGTESVRRLNREISAPDAHSGFRRLAQEAKAAYDSIDGSAVKAARSAAVAARSRGANASTGVSPHMAIVGGKVFRVGPADPADEPTALGAWLKRNQGTTYSSTGQALRQGIPMLGRNIKAGIGSIAKGVDFKGAAKEASGLADRVKDGLGHVSDALSPLKTLGVGVGAMAAAAAATGFTLMRASAEFDSSRQSIEAIEGRKGAARALGDLKTLAREPGLGYEQAVHSYSGLRNSGFDQAFTERLIKELANANARGGGNEDSFARIMEQIRQAGTKPFLSQEDLRPIGDAGVPINALLKARYGTGDTEELQKRGITADQALHGLVEDLAKMPRVAGGFQNSLDNLADSIRFAEVGAGDALNHAFLPLGEQLANAVGSLTEDGSIASAFQTVANNINSTFDADQDGMEHVLRELLVGIEDLSAAARNLSENSKGLGGWVKDHVIDNAVQVWNAAGAIGGGEGAQSYDRKYNPKHKGEQPDDFDTSLSGEHDRNEDEQTRQAQTQRERAQMNRAKQAGLFKGNLIGWLKLPRAEQKRLLDEADKREKGGGMPGDNAKSGSAAANASNGTSTAQSPAERTARATEKLVEYKRRQMDIQAASAGGGELARMGVGATELSGNSVSARDRKLMQAVRLIAEYSAFHVVDRQVSDARHASRTY